MQYQSQQQRNPVRDERISTSMAQALEKCHLINDNFEMRLSSTSAEVWVHQLVSTQGGPATKGSLVAYSSMANDRLSSIEEFVSDYFS